MTSPRQKKKKLAALKYLNKQKAQHALELEKAAAETMNKKVLPKEEKHVIDRSDQKQLELTEKNKNGLKEIKNKKTVKTLNTEEESKITATTEITEKVDDQ